MKTSFSLVSKYVKALAGRYNILCKRSVVELYLQSSTTMVLCFLPLICAICKISAQMNVPDYLDAFREDLFDAANQVMEMQNELQESFPDFNMPRDFMHSFIPHTGVGNREDLVIDAIRSVPVFYDDSFHSWRYERFNNSDYVMGLHSKHLFLWKTFLTDKVPFQFSHLDSIFQYTTDDKSVVLDAVMFSRYVSHLERLYVAILSRNRRSSIISIYEIINFKGIMVTVIDLGLRTTGKVENTVGDKLAYVQSQHAGSLVVLVNSKSDHKLVYQQKGSSLLSHYIEVHCQSAVDLVTFSINGHGYIAVANKTFAKVFKMNDFLQNHLTFERFPYIDEITDLEYFRLGFHHYLAIASPHNQTLYVWNSGGFSPKQEFNFPESQQWFSALLPTCRDDIILFLIQKKSTQVFVWNGQTEQFTRVIDAISSGFSPLPGSMTSFSYNTTAFVLFAQNQEDTNIFSITTHLKPVQDPVLAAGKEAAMAMKQLQALVEEQERQLKEVASVLEFAVRLDGNHIFTAPQTIVDFQVTKEVSAGHLNPGNIEWTGSILTLHQYETGSKELEKSVNQLEKHLMEFEKKVQDVLLLNEDSVITGTKTISGVLSASSVSTSFLNMESVSGVNIKKMQSEIYRLDRPRLINGVLTMSQPMTVSGNVDVKQKLNGLDLSEEAMTTDSDQYSEASVTFEDQLRVLGDLNLSGKLGNFDVDTEMVTLSRDHFITGTKSFVNGIIAENVEATLVDGVDIVNLNARAFKISESQVVTGLFSLHRLLYTQDIHLSGKINGYDVVQLSKNLIRVDQMAEIKGTKTFLEDVHVKEALNVRGLLDSRSVPRDFLIPNQSHEITGKKVFEAKIATNNATVYGKVDGINFPTDIITLTTDQTLNGKFYFVDGIVVQNDIAVDGLVDGIDISKLTETSLKLNDTNEIHEVIFLGPLTVLGNIEVGGYVNGHLLEEMVKDMVFKDDPNVVITGPKHFKNVTAGSVIANNMVNDYNLETEFMKSDGVQEIYGTKVFKNPPTFQNIFVENGLIDGVNVQELYDNSIALSLENEAIDKMEFLDTLSIDGNLTIHGTIDGILFPHDVVLKTTNQTIEDKIFVTDSYVHSMRVHGDASVYGAFADIRLSDFANGRVTLSQDENINGSLFLRDTVASTVTISRFENGLNIKEFSENIMSLTKDQMVYSSKEFSGLVSVYGNIVSHGINGINLEKVKEFAFKLHEPNIVSSNFVFTNSLSSEDLKVDGLVNGINLTDLYFDSVKQEGELQVFTKDNIFHGGFHVEGNIRADMVNGMRFQDDILTKTIPQTVTGKYSFLPSVTIMGEASIHGRVNGLDLSEMNNLLAKTDRSNVVRSDLVFTKSVNIYKNMDVVGLFNEVDLNIFDNSLSKVGLISGHKTLIGNVTVYGDINATFINGANWFEFLSDVVRLDVPQNVKSPKIFSSDIDVRGDIYVTDHASVGYINNIDLKRFQDEAVFINKAANITGVKIFTSPIETSGDLIAEFINGLNLKRDVIILQCTDEGIQHIKGSKTFQSVTVTGDIRVEKSVNGYKLQDLFEDTWTRDGGQELLGHKVFVNSVTFEKNVNVKTVNGMLIHRDLVTLDTKQEINGALELMKNAEIVGNLDVSGPVNGVGIRRLAEVSLYLDTNQTVEGSFYISRAIVKSDLVLRGLLNNLLLEEFNEAVEVFYGETYRKNQNWNETLLNHCNETKALISVLESSYSVLDEFVPLQDMNYLADVIQANEDSGEVHLFRIRKHGASASAFSYKYDSKQNMFLPSGRSSQSTVQKKTYRGAYNQSLIINFGPKGTGFNVKIGGIQVPKVHWGFRDAAAISVDGKFLVAVLYPTLELCEVLSFSNLPYKSVKPEIMGKIIVGKEAKAVTIFQTSDDLYLAISCKYDDPTLKGASLIYSWVDKEWQLVQRIPAPSSSHVIHFKYHKDDFLVFSDASPASDSHEPMAAKVYRYGRDNSHPFRLFQKVLFNNALGLDVFEFGGLNDLYLTLFNETVVQIFRLEGEAGFLSVFTLHTDCITTAKPVVLNRQLFLIISQKIKLGRHPVTIVYKGVTQGPNPSRKKLVYCP